MPVEAWEEVAEVLEGREWTRLQAVADLRWWQDRIRAGRASRIPGRPTLRARWSWTDHQVRSLLRDEDSWKDRFASASPAGRQRVASASPAPEPSKPDNEPETASASPAGRQPVASESPHARSRSQNTDTDTDTVWSAYKDIHPRARKRPPGMGARVKEHGAEAVALMLRWVRDADGRAAFLREGGHTGKTLFRPSNCGEYIEMAEAWAANGSPVARTAANDPATAAWAEMMALPSWASADRRNVPRCERYPNAWMLAKDETEHGRRLSAVSRAGGWQTWCNDRANRWKVDEFSARFRAAYGEG